MLGGVVTKAKDANFKLLVRNAPLISRSRPFAHNSGCNPNRQTNSTVAAVGTKGPKIASGNLPKVPNADEIEENRVLSELLGSFWLKKSRVSACLDLKNRR